jgi:hypothetical protein
MPWNHSGHTQAIYGWGPKRPDVRGGYPRVQSLARAFLVNNAPARRPSSGGRLTSQQQEMRDDDVRGAAVIPAPDNRWTFVVECRAPRTYATIEEAERRGEQHAKDLIDRESV